MSQGRIRERSLTAQAARQPSGMCLARRALRKLRWAMMLTQTALCLRAMSSRQLMWGVGQGIGRASAGTIPGRELPFIHTPLELCLGGKQWEPQWRPVH